MKKAGDLLNLYFDDVQKRQGEQYSNFHNSWKEISGEKIGLNTKIKDVEDGKLIIEIDHPGWKQLILLKERYILKKINKNFPELQVKKIVFYYKNDNKIHMKQKAEQNLIEDEKNEIELENKNFSDLLKKMSKRSEE